MADVHRFLLGMVIMVMVSLSAVHTHECDCSKECSQFGAKLQDCLIPFLDVSNTDICGSYVDAEMCMAPLLESICAGPELLDGWNRQIEEISRACSTLSTPSTLTTSTTTPTAAPSTTRTYTCSKFDDEASHCFTGITNGSGPGSTNEEVCILFAELQLCIDPFIAACPDEAAGSNNMWVYETITSQMEFYNC